MKSVLRIFSFTLLASTILPFSIFAGGPNKSIYGADNRQDYFAAPADMKLLADSVVSLWGSWQVAGDGRVFKLATVNFGKALNLCASERFKEQPAGAFCSGSLVGDDIVMTAGHCITDAAKCADTKFVFGFAVKTNGGAAATSVPVSEVYGCKKIIKRELSEPPTGILSGIAALIGSMINGGTGPDYALVQLDRKVTGHKPLPVNRNQRLAKGDKLFVIGHPVGLPVKVAGDAKVRNASPRYFFMTDLDTFGGNSGSAVFNAKTMLIEGILVRGGTDFVKSPAGCTVSYQVGQEQGDGEAVTRISTLSGSIPAIAGNKEAPQFQNMKIGDVSGEGMGDRVNLQFE
jgi:V8-like Glu-specific endopeptidase